MRVETLYRVSGFAVFVGATVGAVVTALELVTSPYNPYSSALWINPWLHMMKYVAMIVLILGLPAVFVRQREHAGILGFVSMLMVCLGIAFAGTPYNVMEWSLDPALSKEQAAATLDKLYSTTVIWGILGMPGFLSFLLGYLLLAIATLRAKVLPRWTAVFSLISFALGIASIFVGSALPGLVPHPPAWLLLGLTGYGLVLIRGTSAQATDPAVPLIPDLGARGTAARG